MCDYLGAVFSAVFLLTMCGCLTLMLTAFMFVEKERKRRKRIMAAFGCAAAITTLIVFTAAMWERVEWRCMAVSIDAT